jgi:hypothetical protein
MSYLVVCVVALMASGLTLLMVVRRLLGPAGRTPGHTRPWPAAGVHARVRYARARAVLPFGLPAIPGALVGAVSFGLV